MKPFHATLVFLLIILPSLLIGTNNYQREELAIIMDMNQALALTLSEQNIGAITPDTITNYRQHLRIASLREKSYVYYSSANAQKRLTSRRMLWRNNNRYEFQTYADISMASVLAMSDQRLPATLSSLAMMWLMFSTWHFRRKGNKKKLFGGICFDNTQQQFYNAGHEKIKLTPMQKQFLTMLWQADDHSVDKKTICNSLWPKKPDANDTLYTLVKRMKKTLDTNSWLAIFSDRNGNYRLEEK